jgi:hypothetical protein
MSLLKAALGAAATAYMNDTVARPRSVGRLARGYCDSVGKPLLLIRGERVADVLLGDPVKADLVLRRAYPIPVPDKTFGGVMVVNVLERLRRPGVALTEWRRIADKVYVVTPSWWAPHTWMDPGNRWLVHPDLTRAAPLWNGNRQTVHLPTVSDSRYGTRRWSPKTSQLPSPSPRRWTPPPSPSQSLPSRPDADSAPRPSETRWPTEETPLEPGLYVREVPGLPDDLSDLTSSDLPEDPMGSGPSSLSGSPSALTIVSTPTFGDG